MSKTLRTEVLQCKCTNSMRQAVEKECAKLDLSISSYLELVIGKHLSNVNSRTLYNHIEI